MPVPIPELSAPRVSIGLPIYNGEKHLRGAIESLLTQDYSNFELILSDNASTDRTHEICQAYADRDRRVRLFANKTNIGAARNFNRVFELATGKYFMWAAHDDRWNSKYVSKCVEELETHPNCVLCASDIDFIDESDRPQALPWRYNRLDTRDLDLRTRVRVLTSEVNWYAFYGVIRADALRKTHLFRGVYGGDVLLLMELLFHGEIRILDEKLFSYRLSEKSESKQLQDISGDGRRVQERPNTTLAREVLDLILEQRFPASVEQAMVEDLVRNLSADGASWRNALMSENVALAAVHPAFVPTEIKVLLTPLMAPAETARLREEARRRFVSQLPISKRLAYLARRTYERNIAWRFGTLRSRTESNGSSGIDLPRQRRK